MEPCLLHPFLSVTPSSLPAINRDLRLRILAECGGDRKRRNSPRRDARDPVRRDRSVSRQIQAKVRVLLMLPDRIRGSTESVWRMVICATAILPVRNWARVSTPDRALRSNG